MSKNSCDNNTVCLPTYLNNTEPLELEDIPLQVALLTMELAAMRTAQAQTAALLRRLAHLIDPKEFDDGTQSR